MGFTEPAGLPTRAILLGRGRELYFWSFVVAILIFGLGAGLSAYEGLTRLADLRPVESPLISLAVLVVCGAAESWSWSVARAELRKALPDCDLLAAISRSRNPAIFIVLLEDTGAIAGIAAAFIGVALSAFAGMPVFDGIASLAVAAILAVTAVYMAVEVKGLLIGEPAPRRIADGIGALATREEAIERVNDLFTIQLGPDQVVALLRAQFRPALPAADLTEAVGRLRSAVRKAFPQVVAVFVTPDSAAKEKQT